MRVTKIELQPSVARALAKVCEEEYRSASDQIRFMLDKCYNIKTNTDSSEVTSTDKARRQGLPLHDKTSHSWRVLVICGVLDKAKLLVTTNNVIKRVNSATPRLTEQQVSSALSNLMSNGGYLSRTGTADKGRAVYKLTELGKHKLAEGNDNAGS